MRGLRITVECTMVQRYLTYQVLRRDASRDDIGQTATARASSISVIEPRSWPMTSKKLSRCSWVRARADFRFPAGNLVEEEHGGRRSGLAAQARVDDLLTQDDLDFMQLPIGNCRSLHLWEHTHTLPRADSGGGAKRHLTDRGRPRRVGRVPQVAAVRHDDTVRVGALDRHRGRAAVARPPEIPLPLAAIGPVQKTGVVRRVTQWPCRSSAPLT